MLFIVINIFQIQILYISSNLLVNLKLIILLLKIELFKSKFIKFNFGLNLFIILNYFKKFIIISCSLLIQ